MNKNILLFIIVLIGINAVCGQWLNQDVTRTIDLTTQISKSIIQIKAKNTGSDSSTYQFAINKSYKASLAVLDEQSKDLPVRFVETKQEFNIYEAKFNSVVKSGSTVSLKVALTLLQQMKPYPEHISQTETQLVTYKDNVYFSSPYQTETQKTTVKVPTGRMESFTDIEPTQSKSSQVIYGPYKDVKGLQQTEFTVHFENNSPFLMLNKLEKEYEVSMWGNLAVETNYYFEHRGAKLKGAFSRLDYQRNPSASASHVSEIKEIVPRDSADFYYRDQIGNISTSTYTYNTNSITLKIVPRFPLYGGWKNEFYTGYNLPIDKFLSRDLDTGRYVLNVSMGVNIEGIYVGDHEIRFVLPEGASDIEFKLPNQIQPVSHRFENRKTFLDTVGRPVLIISTHDTTYENLRYVQVSFNLSYFSIFHEALLVTGAVFAFCILVMILTRVDFSLSKVKSN
ncbi:dolichyl-diphosphooligosaccharide-protein glycotransferase [Tieghemostelium lacteum]|uniref:Dolichyl-diphosphooligosaccharide--protein glycosyltransferase subunit 1 n=1 Tax=Tieghemostelium lacteum TaxID=361077 RepID=A0A152A0Y3_TIELA|nr:dolichyl-diphosphooligosaccharide-protein glycotransferase [Tieghemostelium lacteum]|eukprot:KYQ99885.1 dolichyl-diphosphooligosaccharide-protein glycotransferase [Tieghemostelium lacteum]